jgi:ABC-2 type transport system ATP-binding protein
MPIAGASVVDAAILTEGLTKDYGAIRALDGLSLRVERGEIFGFLGPNGAGKTTTIRLLLDLIRPTAGSAHILGFNCHHESHRVRAVTGYLPGDVRLYPNLTVRQTIDLIAGMRRQAIDASFLAELAGRLDLDLAHRVGTLSKGNRQKVGLVLALLGRPDVLLLDEPTSGLDPLAQQAVWEILRKEAARGAAVFFSSHVMSEVEHVCERVAILRGGQLVAVEPIARLKGRQLRRIDVTFGAPPPVDAFRIPEVREIGRQGTTVTLEVAGNLDRVVKTLGQYPVVDLRTEQPSLDEVLLTFYQET